MLDSAVLPVVTVSLVEVLAGVKSPMPGEQVYLVSSGDEDDAEDCDRAAAAAAAHVVGTAAVAITHCKPRLAAVSLHCLNSSPRFLRLLPLHVMDHLRHFLLMM